MPEITFWNPNKEPDKAGITRDKEESRTCTDWGLDMSGHSLWNPAKEPDLSDLTEDFVVR
jgi:hypothetical protein